MSARRAGSKEVLKYLRVEDPVLNVLVGIAGLVRGLIPIALDLAGEALGILLGAFLDLLALGVQVVCELAYVPLAVGLSDVIVPVVLDEVLEILAVRGSGVWDVVVGEPSFQLCLVPFVVDYAALC